MFAANLANSLPTKVAINLCFLDKTARSRKDKDLKMIWMHLNLFLHSLTKMYKVHPASFFALQGLIFVIEIDASNYVRISNQHES